jgi:hypothetical protein
MGVATACAAVAAAAAAATAAAAPLPPSPFPLLPLVVVNTSGWPAPSASGDHLGEIRAVLAVPAPGATTAQIYWRRRDTAPAEKLLVVTDAAGAPLPANATIQAECGIVAFTAPAAGTYYVYPLPYTQTGDDAWIHFHWLNCTNTTNHACVLGAAARHAAAPGGADVCASVQPGPSALAVRLETRDAFQGYAVNELIATPGEVAAMVAAYPVAAAPFLAFAWPADPPSRLFDAVPAVWALRDPAVSPPNAVNLTAPPGNVVPLQIGLYGHAGAVGNVTIAFSPLAPVGGGAPGRAPIPASALTCLNAGGVDVAGQPFTLDVSVGAGAITVLWVLITTPADAGAAGGYTGVVTLSAPGGAGGAVPVSVSLTLAGPVNPTAGFEDPSSLARLAWLDSTLGLEDTVPKPFVAVGAAPPAADGSLNVTALNKVVTLGPGGLPAAITVATPKVRAGANVTRFKSLLATPVAFTLYDVSGAPVPAAVSSPVAVTSLTNSSVAWSASSTATLPGGGTVRIDVTGSLWFESFGNYAVTLTATSPAAVALSDARLAYTLSPDVLTYVAGMGLQGSAWPTTPDPSTGLAWSWRWNAGAPSARVWGGRVDAGMLLSLRGPEPAWESPMYAQDFPVVPYVPDTWGGVGAAGTGNAYGVNATVGGEIAAFSGPRTLAPGVPVTFYFDLALTPSKTLDMRAHWAMRTFQVGYGTPYYTPQAVAAMGATIVTLHRESPVGARHLHLPRLPYAPPIPRGHHPPVSPCHTRLRTTRPPRPQPSHVQRASRASSTGPW